MKRVESPEDGVTEKNGVHVYLSCKDGLLAKVVRVRLNIVLRRPTTLGYTICALSDQQSIFSLVLMLHFLLTHLLVPVRELQE